MARALLYQESYFYEHSYVDENANYDLVRPAMWNAQELYIQDIIGTPLYNELKDQVENSTLTALNTTLIDSYIAPCLLHYTLMDVQVSLLYKMRNLSVNTSRSDYSDAIEFSEHKYLKDEFRIKAEAYAEKIERYLCANLSSYPKYTTYTSSDEVRAQKQKPTVSVYLGGGMKASSFDWEYPYTKK